jgi:hypothetical protein
MVSLANVQDTVWNERKVRRRVSSSTRAVEAMQPGEVKKIFHYDLGCRRLNNNDYVCSLRSAALRIARETGKLFDTYHEEQNVLVIRRVK